MQHVHLCVGQTRKEYFITEKREQMDKKYSKTTYEFNEEDIMSALFVCLSYIVYL
jgi:hypothetical protein